MSTIAKEVKPGDILSVTQYFTVKSANPKNGNYIVNDDNGLEIRIEGNSIVEGMASANQFTSTQKVSRTELAEIFKSHPRTAITVNFNTKVEEKEVVEKLTETYPNKGKMVSKTAFESTVKKAVKEALIGAERTMIGRHYGSVDDFGRIHFVDMSLTKDSSKSYDSRQRTVDPRTINWIIVNGVKYTQK